MDVMGNNAPKGDLTDAVCDGTPDNDHVAAPWPQTGADAHDGGGTKT